MLDAVTIGHGAVALGIGMLVGLERERKKGRSEDHAAAGLRTFAITALLGYVCMLLAGAMLVGVVSVGLVFMVYMHGSKQAGAAPDVTGENALLLVLMLGALSLNEPEFATAVGVILTVLLALRRELHHFVLQQLSEEEVRDGLMLLTVALVVLPLTPDRFLGPYGVLNPRTICTLVVLLMAVGALGHIAVRLMGPRYGLPMSAIASGFASGSATIALLAHEARRQGTALRSLAAAAVLSNLATLTQFALVLGFVERRLLTPFVTPIGLGALVTVVCGMGVLAPWRTAPSGSAAHQGNGAFSLWTALIITGALTGVALFSAFLLQQLGRNGLGIAAFVSGLGDAHAAIASVASLVVAGRLEAVDLLVPVMMALTGNALTKCVLAFSNGGFKFARYLIPAQVAILAAMWSGLLIQG
ncbi:MgtC/SapB family protein [Pseudomonas sp. UFMG81]|uniref:MgtC/SapB family protein n=1 Tax=Pseudomonas sp. UFMG81 TaxID=2745936 RepID=UPI001890289F|nr:MgtC/SapB family protein [Pseudomonas sp. UFMG81]